MKCSSFNESIPWILEVHLCTVLCDMDYFPMNYDHMQLMFVLSFPTQRM